MNRHAPTTDHALDLRRAFDASGQLTEEVRAAFMALEPGAAGAATIELIVQAATLRSDERLAAARSIYDLVSDYPGRPELDRERLASMLLPLDATDPLRYLIRDLIDPPSAAAVAPTTRGYHPPAEAAGAPAGAPEATPPPAVTRGARATPPGTTATTSSRLGSGPHVAYGLLRSPAEVVAGEEFALDVGLSREPAEGVAGQPLNLPAPGAKPYTVDVRIVATGFEFPGAETPRRELKVSSDQPYPVIEVRLIPKRPSKSEVDRRVTAEFSISGERLADAIRSIRVVRSADLRTRPATERVETGVNVLAPTGDEVADLTITLRYSDRDGWLDWTFDSPHRDVVTPPAEALSSRVGDTAEFLRSQIRQIDQAEGKQGIYDDVRGLGWRVAGVIPPEVWTAIRAVAAKKAHASAEPPTILLVSEDPYVPWELALVEPPLEASTAPPFLAAQARIGRWVQAVEQVGGRTRPSPNPPHAKDVAALAVVWGSYEGTEWSDLDHAEKEAKALEKLYGASTIAATSKAMFDLLRGTPRPDLLHFAVHGQYEPTDPGGESGIILTDGETLHANEIASRDLSSNPVVFLNACQVAAGRLELGAYSGVAAAFVEAGASAVVAPLWSVDDGIAKTIALTFYERVAQGEAPSEVLRDARQGFVDEFETTSATYMAYQLFGHPSFAIRGLPSK